MEKKRKVVNFKTPFSIFLTKRNTLVPIYTCILSLLFLFLINYVSLIELSVFPGIEDNDVFLIVWIAGTAVSAGLFIISFVLLVISLFKVITWRISVDSKEVKIRNLFRTTTVPRSELKGIRMAQESKNDIKHNVGTLRLLFKNGKVFYFGRVDHQLELAHFMRKYASNPKTH